MCVQRDYAPVVPGLVWTLQCGQGLSMTVRAAQLQHRLPCWGYVFTELPALGEAGRKVVLLGDTCDSHAIAGSHDATAVYVSHVCRHFC